ncbi:olfactory receptor 2D3-like [Trachypithecus francoisi]|uniref:olfactory receptor 2D3-like n=1 Tax=Trachypithecus francoisi TaxID=54180 RepID=UPI00141B549D|nr:olfactory receptor 2D3-like [Trachypithecus francoisi]
MSKGCKDTCLHVLYTLDSAAKQRNETVTQKIKDNLRFLLKGQIFFIFKFIYLHPFTRCSIQMLFFLTAGCTESSLLAVMSYDHYVAVCKPLHYSTLMTQIICIQLVMGCWASGAFVSLVDTTFTLCLPYQGQNIINHYFCEPPALLKLASANTYSTEMTIFAIVVVILLGLASLILFSYWNIISTVIQIQSEEGRLKVFSTCGSYFIVVFLFYRSTIFTYMQPNLEQMNKGDKVVSVFYSVITSVINPFIYSLRNKDVKEAFRKVFRK